MNKQILNKTYYQKNQEIIKAGQKERYQSKKQQTHSLKKSNLGEYYYANNIRILISLKEYLDSSPERMKLWYQFSNALSQIKEEVWDIIPIMRLREVMEDLIKDYWTTAKKNIRISKKWNKLSEKQKLAKRKQWAEELKKEEAELFKQFQKQQANERQKQKSPATEILQSKQNKEQCPDCNKFFKELNEEHDICVNCLQQYEN
ncbi:MAG: hypothetical protein mread185_000212 [Mycoplasmataceae bacterium]|nr:MAG: hypothetical protein mread185_000212 [Mycoplasmataceae bacterium]